MSDLAFEVRAPLGLELATGERLTIEAWSLEGFTFPGESDLLPKEATLAIPFQGIDIRFPVSLSHEQGTRHLRFQGLTVRQRETLSVFYRSLLSGRMAVTEDVITSLDTPVDLVPMGETEQEQQEGSVGKAPRAVRAALAVSIYLMLAALLFWTLGSGIYGKLASVAIQNARIEAPILPHVAPNSAYVKRIEAPLGTEVEAGDVLVRLTTPESEAGLTEIRARIDLLDQRRSIALQRLEELTAPPRSALPKTTVHFVDLPDGRRAVLRLPAAPVKNPPEISDLRRALEREIDGIADELRRLRRERGRLREAADALHIIAAAPGTVTALHLSAGQFVSRGALVLELEERAPRLARGWVDQTMATAFHPGMTVAVMLNEGGQQRRLVGHVLHLEAGVDPALSPDFGTLVTVGLKDLTVAELRQDFPHLMPLELVAKRRWSEDLSAKLVSLWPGQAAN